MRLWFFKWINIVFKQYSLTTVWWWVYIQFTTNKKTTQHDYDEECLHIIILFIINYKIKMYMEN